MIFCVKLFHCVVRFIPFDTSAVILLTVTDMPYNISSLKKILIIIVKVFMILILFRKIGRV